MRIIEIPPSSLVILGGPAGCGKSTFARKHFLETQIVSSDRCRAIISDDEENMTVSGKAFKLFHLIIDMRLSVNRLTVADSTALTRTARKRLKKMADKYNFNTVFILLNVPIQFCLEQNASRQRVVDPTVIEKHIHSLKKVVKDIPHEGYTKYHILGEQEIPNTEIKVV